MNIQDPLRCILRSRIAESYNNFIFKFFEESLYCFFPLWLYHFRIPTNNAQWFQFLHIVFLFSFGCEVISHGEFDLNFPN